MKKGGQITIFIIVGIIIISVIALFFLFRSGIVPGIGEKPEKNPNIFLEACMEDKIKEAIEIISLQGGYISNPLHKSIKFEAEDSPVNISYLCYNQNYYSPCINQEPMLIQHLKSEIKDYISKDVEDCFTELGKSLGKQGYVVDATYRNFEVRLMEKKVIMEIDAKITLTKSGEASTQEDFKVIIPSRLYDLANVVQEVVNKEATNCEFSHYDMFLYPEFNINKFTTADSSIIYIIKHEDSKEEFRFAVRGCVIPPGY